MLIARFFGFMVEVEGLGTSIW